MSGGHNKKVTPKLVEKFKAKRAKGMSYKQIGDIFGVNETTVWLWLNPKQMEKRLEESRMRRSAYCREYQFSGASTEQDWLKRRKDIPRGPVSLNQALLGDPLPGRSALDIRQREQL